MDEQLHVYPVVPERCLVQSSLIRACLDYSFSQKIGFEVDALLRSERITRRKQDRKAVVAQLNRGNSQIIRWLYRKRKLHFPSSNSLPERVVIPIDHLDSDPRIVLKACQKLALFPVSHIHAQKPDAHKLSFRLPDLANVGHTSIPKPIFLMEVAQQDPARPRKLNALFAPDEQLGIQLLLQPLHAFRQTLPRKVQRTSGLCNGTRRAERAKIPLLVRIHAKLCHSHLPRPWRLYIPNASRRAKRTTDPFPNAPV